MYYVLLISGSTLLIFSFIWGYLWLEVLSDPKNELQSFYAQNRSVHKAITALNKIWLPALLLGASLITASFFIS